MRLEDAIPDLVWLDQLPGKKLIGRGNHDYWWDTVAKMERAFDAAGITTISFLHNNAHLVEGRVLCGTRGWFFDGKTAPRDGDFAKISAREAMRLEASLAEGERLAAAQGISTPPLVFLHFPPVFGDACIPELVEILQKHHVTDCFFGHIHGVYNIPQTTTWGGIRMTLISADYLDFTPYRIPAHMNKI
jgi:predicted phosphohydrolase